MKIDLDTGIITGTFYMVQRGDVGMNTFVTPHVPKCDMHGNPKVEWPGRSIYATEPEASKVASILRAEAPQYPFYVMKCVGVPLL